MDPAQDLADYHRAQAADRDMLAAFVRDLPPPAEPVHDYITDLDERCALFEELRKLHRDLGLGMPNRATLAVFMVAPTSQIREQLVIVRETPPEHIKQRLYDTNLKALNAMSSCMFLQSTVSSLI